MTDQCLYGLTEMEKNANESTEAYEIVSEIIQFGVTQRQILMIIKRLALNLENNDFMKIISKLANECLEEIENKNNVINIGE